MKTIITALLCITSLAEGFEVLLPPGVQSEGVTHAAGSIYLASDLRGGAVYSVDIKSQLITTAVPPSPSRAGVGLWASETMIFMAGGGFIPTPTNERTEIKPTLYVFDLARGTTLAACVIKKGGFVNDVTADSQFAYYTDSFRGVVYRLTLSKVERCVVKEIPLPRTAFPNEVGVFRGNGIVLFKTGIIIANSEKRTVYYVDLGKGSKFSANAILPPGSLPFPDGLEIKEVGRKGKKAFLYVAQNRLNVVSEWKLDVRKQIVTATFVRNITSSGFDTPTTVAVKGKTLVAANARFADFGPTDVVGPKEQFTLSVLRI